MFAQAQQDPKGMRQVFATSRRHWTSGRQFRKEWRSARLPESVARQVDTGSAEVELS